MVSKEPKEIIRAKELLQEAKFDEALEIIEQFENFESPSPENQLSALLLKGKIYQYKGRYKKMVNISERAYQMSQKLGFISETIDALCLKAHIAHLRRQEDDLEYILEAEQLIDTYSGKSGSVLPRQRANILYTKSWIFYHSGEDFDHTLEIALQCLAIREKLGEKLDISYSLFQIGSILLSTGDLNKALDYFKKSVTLRSELNFRRGIAQSLTNLGACYFNRGELEEAIKSCKQALSFKEINTRDISRNLNNLGQVDLTKGELNKALKYIKQGISLAEEEKDWFWLAWHHHNMGWFYTLKGDSNRSIEYMESSLELAKKGKNLDLFPVVFFVLIFIEIDRNSRKQAQDYLKQFEELVDLSRSKMSTQRYLMAKSRMLSTSGRRRDSAEAEMLLKKIIDDEIVSPSNYIYSLSVLCFLLIEELSMYNNSIVLDEINPLIKQLIDFAEKQHSYFWLADAKLLQAKVKLIQLDIGGAKQLLVEAQRIAELHDIQQLAIWISREHDSLLEQINLWNNLKKRKAPMSERIKLASIDEVIDRLEGKRVIEPPELTQEEPVLLLIITEGGVPVFSKSFTEEWSYDNGKISNFLTAFNTFSEDVFSKGLDRANFGEYILVIDSVDDFSLCYLFKGQSYVAKQKLIQFAHHMQNTKSIWRAFEDFHTTRQAIILTENPSLESLITEIFMSNG
ncbi:MAG: tetratricopeptide repeat protein [Promethearchaeota archaeon]|jgi:tetratricopeptide (TPR) repeat protein